MIRPANRDDADSLARIYNHYIEHTVITFEETPVTGEEMRSRMVGTPSGLPWFVYQSGSEIIGYTYASPWNRRSAYRYSAESTVYLAHDSLGKGIGKQLYEHLLSDLRSRSIHAVIGGIAIPNPSSVALHESLGYRKVAHYEQVGWKFGKWIDVGYWQLIFH